MDRFPKKPCKFCHDPKPNHFPYQCPINPKVALKRKVGLKRTPIKKIGKQTKQWFVTRATWIRKNPPDENGYWYCYLRIHPWCPGKLTVDKDLVNYDVGMLTLDHVVARTRDGTKKFTQSNLKPACGYCNEQKGSKSLDQVKGNNV
jgi:5-methylcytosine-specific restriction endonuclease McrA